MTFLEIYDVWFVGPCFKSYLSYKFDRPETIRGRAKMKCVVGHRVRRLSRYYFEPSFGVALVLGQH